MRAAWLMGLVALVSFALPARAEEPEARAGTLLAAGEVGEAVELLKAALRAEPESTRLRWLLARAYLASENQVWALRVLSELASLAPEDCEPGLWSARIFMGQGALEDAREALEGAICPAGSPARTRRSLLLAQLARLEGDEDAARVQLEEARGAPIAHPEDRQALERLTQALDPDFVMPLVGRLELQAGWVQTALAGSPLDPAAAGQDASSPAVLAAGWLRFVPPTGRWLRPSVEVDGRLAFYTSEAGRDLSYVQVGARTGFLIGPGQPRALVAYRFDELLLYGGDRYASGPNWFYEGHRAELEVELLPSLTLFGGAGRRLFRELGRSRTEVDGGLGGGLPVADFVRLLGAVTARYHDADKDAYDLWGLSLLVSADFRLPERFSVRLGVLFGYDEFRRSAGYFDAARPEDARRDLSLRLSVSAWSPPLLPGLRAGVTYEHAGRYSTADPYDFQDHRVWLKLAWTFSFDPWLPRDADRDGLRALDHGLESAEQEERIQDLLRQDEAAQRSSSCVE
jgi:tetratricopeptide (TPR) repeat protein